MSLCPSWACAHDIAVHQMLPSRSSLTKTQNCAKSSDFQLPRSASSIVMRGAIRQQSSVLSVNRTWRYNRPSLTSGFNSGSQGEKQTDAEESERSSLAQLWLRECGSLLKVFAPPDLEVPIECKTSAIFRNTCSSIDV
jgi:hypothetical protein